MNDDKDTRLADIVDFEERSTPTYDSRPSEPERYDPNIALIGVGGVGEQHLKAYTRSDYDILALCPVSTREDT